MTTLKTEKEIIANWKQCPSDTKVSICCAAFNHQKFISKTLNGFLIQQTDFPFEVLIHDDASTDETAEIIRQYQKKYPSIIKPIFQTENQYQKGIKVGQTVIPYIKSPYVAICEGDDYWVDPNKLQIQIDFLERNSDYVVSGHDVCSINDGGELIKRSRVLIEHKRDFSGEELVKGIGWIANVSRVYRNVLTEFPPERTFVKNGDKFALSTLGLFGKSKYHDNILPAAYRVHSGGVWSLVSKRERLETQINTHFWLYRYFVRINEFSYAQYYWQKYLAYVLRASNPVEIAKAFIYRLFRWSWKKNK